VSFLGLFDYPKAISQLKAQMPKNERDTFINSYKKLSPQEKKSFKELLQKADTVSASKVLGKDITQYTVKADSKSAKVAANQGKAAKVQPQTANNPGTVATTATESNFTARINKILAVPTSIDPELVKAAARRYQEAVPMVTETHTKAAAVSSYKDAMASTGKVKQPKAVKTQKVAKQHKEVNKQPKI
jgi:hypothetical protein